MYTTAAKQIKDMETQTTQTNTANILRKGETTAVQPQSLMSTKNAPVEMAMSLHEAIDAALLRRPRVKRVGHHGQSPNYGPPGAP